MEGNWNYAYLFSDKVPLWKRQSVMSPILQLISSSKGNNSGLTIPTLTKPYINTNIIHPKTKERKQNDV